MSTEDPKEEKKRHEGKRKKEEVEEHEWDDSNYRPPEKRPPMVFQRGEQEVNFLEWDYTYTSPKKISKLIEKYEKLKRDLRFAKETLLKNKAQRDAKQHTFTGGLHQSRKKMNQKEMKIMDEHAAEIFAVELLMKAIKSEEGVSEIPLLARLQIKKPKEYKEKKESEKPLDPKEFAKIKEKIMDVVNQHHKKLDDLFEMINKEMFIKYELTMQEAERIIYGKNIQKPKIILEALSKIQQTIQEEVEKLYDELNKIFGEYFPGREGLKTMKQFAYEQVKAHVHKQMPLLDSSMLLSSSRATDLKVPQELQKLMEVYLNELKGINSIEKIRDNNINTNEKMLKIFSEMQLSKGDIRDLKDLLSSRMHVASQSKVVELIEREMKYVKGKINKEYENDPELVQKLMDIQQVGKSSGLLNKPQKPPKLGG